VPAAPLRVPAGQPPFAAAFARVREELDVPASFPPEVEAEAEALAALGLEEKGAVVVTAAAGWHPGCSPTS
jgi:hypothetical protein